jgi:antitoxin component of MazEF toxin-antitoxin module
MPIRRIPKRILKKSKLEKDIEIVLNLAEILDSPKKKKKKIEIPPKIGREIKNAANTAGRGRRPRRG